MPIEADTKDWTWILEQTCPECGFEADAVTVDALPGMLRDNAHGWRHLLAGDPNMLGTRPSEQVWSPLEYACHVRDVHRVFIERVRMMLAESEPTFPAWDQDRAALAGDYGGQDPTEVSAELSSAAAEAADLYAAVSGVQWGRTESRGGGSAFTVDSLGRYHLHDVVHHLHDVGHDPVTATVAAYAAHARAYGADKAEPPEWIRDLVDRFVAALPSGARILEIGSAHGRDALALEAAGLSVRRTDITPTFVEILRAEGHPADVIDPLHDDLADPERPGEPYDAVWASGSLLHVARQDLPRVFARLAAATRSGGRFHLGLKEGDGDAWSTHGTGGAPRHFTFWREGPLIEALTAAGWLVDSVERTPGRRDEGWLNVVARRR